jgi:hypothetical protein
MKLIQLPIFLVIIEFSIRECIFWLFVMKLNQIGNICTKLYFAIECFMVFS